MPTERDPESTSFDHRPWGGQQRLVPLAARFARGTDAPENEPAAAPAPAVTRPAPAVTRPVAASKRPAHPAVINPAKAAARPIIINPAKPAATTRPVVINPAKTTSAPVVAAPAPIVAAPVSRPATAPLVPAPSPIIPARDDDAFREQPTIDSVPIARVSLPVDVDTEHSLPSLGTSAIMSAPVEPMALPMLTPVPGTLPPAPSTSLPTVSMRAADVSTDVNPAQPAFVPVAQYPAVAMYAAPAMYSAAPAVAVSSTRAPQPIAAFSVKEGRALNGFVVPHLPKVCEVFRNSDATVAVRRRPLTARSIIAIPVGAVVATVAILMIYLAQPAQAKSTAPAASQSKPQVMTVTAESVVMQTVSAPAPVEPVAAAPVALSAPVAAEPVIVAAELASEKAETPSKKHRSKRHHKPRRIKAVDASTPLGGLRPDDLERP